MAVRTAEAALVRQLQLAYSGELAAARAYAGHWRSVRDPGQKERIRQIMHEELEHRAAVLQMLQTLGGGPRRVRDRFMWCLGTAIGASCFVGGWYAPMYGAGKIERRNIREYEDAARFAVASGHPGFVEDLLRMAEVEWDHEKYFHDHVRSHWLHRRTGSWPAPPPREEIRASFLHEHPAAAPAPMAVAAAKPVKRAAASPRR